MEQQNHMERAEAFIALVKESTGLSQKNIQRARGYVSILLTEQESKGVPTMKSKGDGEGTPPAISLSRVVLPFAALSEGSQTVKFSV